MTPMMVLLEWVLKIAYAISVTIVVVGIIYELEEGDSTWRKKPIHMVRTWIATHARHSGPRT